MGEANYYGGIVFTSASAARAARAPISRFLRKGTAAYDDWQSHRDSNSGGKRVSAKERFQGIAARNREVFEAMGLTNRYDEYIAQFRQQGEKDVEDGGLNCLAGQMSFPDDPTVSVEGATVTFFGVTWHMADWGRLVEGMRKRFGGEKAAWISDARMGGGAKAALMATLGEVHGRKKRKLRPATEALPVMAGATA